MLFAKLNDLSIGGKGSYGIAASAVERKADLPTYLRITDIFDDGTLNLSELKRSMLLIQTSTSLNPMTLFLHEPEEVQGATIFTTEVTGCLYMLDS